MRHILKAIGIVAGCMLALALLTAQSLPDVGGGGGPAGPAGPAFTGGELTSSLELDPTNTTCAQALALAWDTDENTGLQRSAADTMKLCLAGADAMTLNAGSVVLPVTSEIGFTNGTNVRKIYYADPSVIWGGTNVALTLFGGTNGPGDTSYVDAIGHLSVSGEMHATDTAFIYGAGGEAIQVFDDFASPARVAKLTATGSLSIGDGGSGGPTPAGLGFLSDNESGQTTGWYRGAPHKWYFKEQGTLTWILGNGMEPQVDLGSGGIGASGRRLTNVQTRGLKSEELIVYASDGTTVIGGITAATGRVRAGDGAASTPALSILSAEGGSGGLGFYKGAGSFDLCLAQGNATPFWCFDGGGLVPGTDHYVNLGGPTKSINAVYADAFMGYQQTAGTIYPGVRTPSGIGASAINLPACTTSAHGGAIIYVDDTDDANSGMFCGCRANSGGTYAWVDIADNTTACIDP